jgi:anti-sigma-K factor RskA
MEPRPEMDALLGAYVLDALDADERARVEEYLEQNPHARAEVDDLRETAAVLATAPVSDMSAPPELWARIASELDPAPAGDELAQRRTARRSRGVWIATAAAVVAAAAAIVLAIVAVSLDTDLDHAREPGSAQLAEAFDRATRIDGAREVDLASDRGDARVVVLPDGTGYLVSDDLQPLDDAQTYQLWAVMGNGADQRIISAGVLGSDPRAAAFRVDGPVAGFAMTVERAGGVPVTEQEPFTSGNLS